MSVCVVVRHTYSFRNGVSVMLKVFQIAIACLCVLALASAAHATIITHDGTPVFQETFEGQIVDVRPSTGNVSPGPGNWTFTGGSVSDTATTFGPASLGPGAFQGTQYMEVVRVGDGGIYAGREIEPISTGQVHVEMMVFQDVNAINEGSVHFNAGSLSDTEGNNSGALLHVYSHQSGSILVYDTPGAFEGSSHFLQREGGGSLTYSLLQWQKWEFDIDLDAESYVVTVAGQTSVEEPLLQTDGTLKFFGTRGTFGPSLAYFDATDAVLVPPTSFEWAGTTPGNWDSSINWTPSGGPPGGADHDVTFGNLVSGGTVATDQTVTVNHVTFDNSNSYFIAGGGSVDLVQDPSGSTDPHIEVLSGSHEFQVKVNLAANTSVNGGANTLDFNNQIDLAGNSLTNSGSVNINHPVIDSVGGGSISSSGTLGTAGSTAIAGDLSSTGTLDFDLAGTHAAQSDAFSVTGVATLEGTVNVDLLDGFVPSSGVTLLHADGGVNTPSGLPTLTGTGVSGFSLSVINGTDLVLNLGGTNTDYDDSGLWDLGDLNLVLFNWQDVEANLPGIWVNQRPATVGLTSLNQVLFNWQQASSLAVVPEPDTLPLLVMACCGFLTYRRK